MNPPEPNTRAALATEALYERLKAEFGLLTAGEVESRFTAGTGMPRGTATAARDAGRLLTLSRGDDTVYPGFQFDDDGDPLPVIAHLRRLAERHGWDEASVVQWLMSPTRYLADEGARPVDFLATQPERVIAAAAEAWNVEW